MSHDNDALLQYLQKVLEVADVAMREQGIPEEVRVKVRSTVLFGEPEVLTRLTERQAQLQQVYPPTYPKGWLSPESRANLGLPPE